MTLRLLFWVISQTHDIQPCQHSRDDRGNVDGGQSRRNSRQGNHKNNDTEDPASDLFHTDKTKNTRKQRHEAHARRDHRTHVQSQYGVKRLNGGIDTPNDIDDADDDLQNQLLTFLCHDFSPL